MQDFYLEPFSGTPENCHEKQTGCLTLEFLQIVTPCNTPSVTRFRSKNVDITM